MRDSTLYIAEPGARGRRRDHPVGFLGRPRRTRAAGDPARRQQARKDARRLRRTENDHRRPGSQRTVCGTDGRRTTRTENKIASDERPARSSARRSICNRMQPAGQTVPDADLGLQHPAEGETQKRRHRRSFVVHATTPGDNRRFIDFIYNNTRTDRPTGGFFHNPRCLPAGLRDLDGGPGTALRPQ